MNNLDQIGTTQSVVGGWGGLGQSASLTDDQKQQVKTILSKYDPNKITPSEAQDVFKQFMDSGIQTGKDLRDTIKAAGFDTYKLRSLASQGINGGSTSTQTKTLTDDQKNQIGSILANYDPKNVSAADAQSIFTQFQKAGIQPGKDLKDTIQAAGFNSDQLTSLAAAKSAPRTNAMSSSSQTQGINTAALQSLQAILNQYDLNNLSQDQQKTLLAQLDQAGLLQSGNIVNFGV